MIFPLFLARLPLIKRALVLRGVFQGSLEQAGIVTYEDKIRYRSPRYRHRILYGQEGHDLIGAMIGRGLPMMVTRLGATELLCLRFYLENRVRKDMPYSHRVRDSIANLSGFFPTDDEHLDAFCKIYLEQLQLVDVMGVWFNYYEDVLCNTLSRNAELVELSCLEPFYFKTPWSARLDGRKVLVVHPFAETIRKQFTEKRSRLFTDPDVLPDFELKTVKAVQSIAGAKVDYATWFDAYHHMCDEMARIDFEICIIGAGAYGLPLAAFAKKLGKQAIHMGGGSQLLFGIKGKRWEEESADATSKLFNEHWVRPSTDETPDNRNIVENGCYW